MSHKQIIKIHVPLLYCFPFETKILILVDKISQNKSVTLSRSSCILLI